MAPAPLPFEPRLARQVKTDELSPHQQTTSRGFKTATDFYQQVMLKHPSLSEFHSRAEYLHAALLEADPDVTSFVPQPFRLWVGKRRYTPDCYVVTDGQPRRVVEIKPRGEMDPALQVPLTHYFAQYGMRFEVISNESVLEREIEAENWAEIVRILHMARDLTTVSAEHRLIEMLRDRGECTLDDVIDTGDRERTYPDEIALFRLLHRGLIRGELTDQVLDLDTRFSLSL